MTSPAKLRITLHDLVTMEFWRYFFNAIWLFFPAILFLFLTYFAFWTLVQGKDVIIITLENRQNFSYFIVAAVFWAYVTWYTSRIVAKAKQFMMPDDHPQWLVIRAQGPRILAFSCFTLLILSFFQLPLRSLPKISMNWCFILFVLSFPMYFLVYEIWEGLAAKQIRGKKNRLRALQKLRIITYAILITAIITVIISQLFWDLILLLILLQYGIVFIMVLRRKLIEEKEKNTVVKRKGPVEINTASGFFRKMKHLLLDSEDYVYFRAFSLICLVGLFIYIATIFSVHFAVKVGTFPFVLLAFGVLLLIGNIVAFISVLIRINIHLILLTLAIVLGYFLEPHYVMLIDKQNKSALFSKRQTLEQYFMSWISDSSRRKAIEDSSSKNFPVYFVLANGGASRSGYWTASLLSKLEDTTEGKFSRHLFCLAGASGGSLGNATFFNILRNKISPRKGNSNMSCLSSATNYLSSDFLTYTLARMLGPDIFRHILPLKGVYDRSGALATALEQASGKKDSVAAAFSSGFSEFMTQVDNSQASLPVLLINTTQMQDGSPGVISNINISSEIFNRRIDVLSLLSEDKDLKLSSAVVLGASFAYFNPAGRIDNYSADHVEPHYFVDGGYFDNDGAGDVNEMMLGLRQIIDKSKDPWLARYKNRIQFYILHITNREVSKIPLNKVSPIINDLASPVETMMTSLFSQTTINDMRLKTYLTSIYGDTSHYSDFNLYRLNDSTNYSMNWVISRHLLSAMDKQLIMNEQLNSVITDMKMKLK